jgi:hypothetical protein
MSDFQFRKAVRKAVPMLLSVSGVSGSGKTYSSLLLAAGLAGPKGRVGFIDTENGRGEMYADSPGIVAALPNGYEYSRLDPPFTPQQYIAALGAAEEAGVTVAVLDSGSHEWEGIGGCCEIAENNKLRGMPNWSMAKMAHKRFMNHLLCTNMHIILCLRAREKVKMVEVERRDGKKTTEVVPIGIQPIAEKNFVFEMLVSLRVEEESHFAVPVKVPEPLVALFPGGKMLTKADGERIRQWNETGSAADSSDRLRNRARVAADEGVEAYKAFFGSITAADRKSLQPIHEEMKYMAEQADMARNQQPAEEVA